VANGYKHVCTASIHCVDVDDRQAARHIADYQMTRPYAPSLAE
jgi:hypothetical protein